MGIEDEDGIFGEGGTWVGGDGGGGREGDGGCWGRMFQTGGEKQ